MIAAAGEKEPKERPTKEYTRCPGCLIPLVAINKHPDEVIEEHAIHCRIVQTHPDMAVLKDRINARRNRMKSEYPSRRR